MTAALVAGLATSLQSRMNGELAVITGVPIEAGLVSFLGGLAVLTMLLVLPAVRRGMGRVGEAVRDGSLKWYQCIGGFIGGIFVVNQTIAVPLLGIALFTVGTVAGQTANGLLVDRFGIGPGGPKPIQGLRVAAALLALFGVVVSVSGALEGSVGVVVPMITTVLVGAGIAIQQGTNGRVTVASRNVFTTTWINFFFGSVLMCVVAAWEFGTGRVHYVSMADAPWWTFLGGVMGIVVVATAAWAVRHLGVLVFGLALLLGQLASALVLDLVNPAARDSVTPTVVAGVLITLVAAALAGRPPRPKAR
ncbi:DMT family transporter [Kribbia dieselivorans]|uniref:DMT family transporter n=1 Tax=Kribbia dieselivorans TaxID=331526 RepID=UPI0024813BBE|nr:DMT family transporter [Kribbia dieselivorans]